MEILSGIGRLGKFWGDSKNFGKLRFFENVSQNLEQYSRFSEGLLFAHSCAQRAFVRAVNPPPPRNIKVQ